MAKKTLLAGVSLVLKLASALVVGGTRLTLNIMSGSAMASKSKSVHACTWCSARFPFIAVSVARAESRYISRCAALREGEYLCATQGAMQQSPACEEGSPFLQNCEW